MAIFLQTSPMMNSFTTGKHRGHSLSAEEVRKGPVVSSSVDFNPSHSQGPRRGRTCFQDHVPGPHVVLLHSDTPCRSASFFAFGLCPQPPTAPLLPSELRFLVFFLIQAGNRVSAGLPLPTDRNLIVSLAQLLISNKNRFCSLAKMIKG